MLIFLSLFFTNLILIVLLVIWSCVSLFFAFTAPRIIQFLALFKMHTILLVLNAFIPLIFRAFLIFAISYSTYLSTLCFSNISSYYTSSVNKTFLYVTVNVKWFDRHSCIGKHIFLLSFYAKFRCGIF